MGYAYKRLTRDIAGVGVAGKLVRVTTDGSTVTPPTTPDPTPGDNLLATRSALIDTATDTTSIGGTNGPNVSVTFDTSWAAPGHTRSLLINLTGQGNDSGFSVPVDVAVTPGKVYRFVIVAKRPSGAQYLYRDLYTTVKWRKSNGSGSTLVSEYQGGAVDSGTVVTTAAFNAIAPAGVDRAQLLVRWPGGAPANSAFQVGDFSVSELVGYTNPTATFERGFARPKVIFPSSTSIWTQDVRSAPLDTNSVNLINTLVTKDLATAGPVFNLLSFASSTYVVSTDHPRMNIGFHDAQHKQYTPTGELFTNGTGAFRDVPVPWEAVSGGGGDSHISIITVDANGVAQELFDDWQWYKDRAITLQEGGVTPARAAAGNYAFRTAAQITAAGDSWAGYSATWGGRITNLTTSNGIFPVNTGTSATGIAAAGGSVGILEAQDGVIDHALYLSIVYPRRYDQFSYPANRSDGFIQTGDGYGINTEDALMEGQRVRLDPTLNLATLGLSPFGLMLAKALQKYGAIVGDKTGAVEFEGESPRPYLQRGLPNPWDAILGSQNIYQNFPWNRLQAIQKDWGKP